MKRPIGVGHDLEYDKCVCVSYPMSGVGGGREGGHPGLPKYPRRALHLSCSDAMFGGVHFSGPPHFGP